MNRKLLAFCVMATVVLMSVGQRDVFAQYNASSARSLRFATRNFLYNRPTVSPYLNLTSRDASFGMPNYFTQVRPQMEAREQAVAAQRQSAQMQQQLNQVQDQVRQTQQDAANMMLTGRIGWSSRGYPRFGTYMSYYPGFQRIGR